MPTNKEEIDLAFDILYAEINKGELNGILLERYNSEWLKIILEGENRNIWLGYKKGNGYFLSWDRKNESSVYFNLSKENIEKLLSLLPSSINNSDNQTQIDSALEFVEQLKAPNPDRFRVKAILEDTSSSPEGLHILASAACLISFKHAIKKFKTIIECNSKTKHKENEIKNLLSEHPWMIGSQYNEVIKKECSIWFHSKIDLLLGSAMGYIDIVELKRPDMEILCKGSRVNTWRNSYALSDVYAQARKYLKAIDEHRYDIVRELNLPRQSVSRMYRSSVIIIAGRTPKNKEALEALKDINVENNRILLMTFDDVLSIAEATVNLFERKFQINPGLIGN